MVHKGDRKRTLQLQIAMSPHVQNSLLNRYRCGRSFNLYKKTSPSLLNSHSVGRGLNRQSRMHQLTQKQDRPKYGDEVPFPKSYLPPDADAMDFECFLGLKEDKQGKDLLPKRSTLFKLRTKQQSQLHERESTHYLSPYEYEHRILESMNATRGLNPRVRVQRRSNHTREYALTSII